jgi:hypothetical protein
VALKLHFKNEKKRKIKLAQNFALKLHHKSVKFVWMHVASFDASVVASQKCKVCMDGPFHLNKNNKMSKHCLLLVVLSESLP